MDGNGIAHTQDLVYRTLAQPWDEQVAYVIVSTWDLPTSNCVKSCQYGAQICCIKLIRGLTRSSKEKCI
jgi:hypothetical protein